MKRVVNNTKFAAKQVGRYCERPKISRSDVSRRIVSVMLCLCMMATMLCNFGGLILSSAFDAKPTGNVMNRIADRDTTDTYIDRLLSNAWGSRYAGRVWTDKSVFAADIGALDGSISLNWDTDGYKGTVGFNSDFGTVFSALTSSQVVNEWPPAPIDLVIAVDMSASMAQDTRCAINNLNDPTDGNSYTNEYGPEERTMAKRIENSRIQKTLDAVNNTIDGLMEQNKENRVSVVVYGAGAAVLMPLAHYARVGNEPYLTVGGMETLYTPDDLKVDSNYGWVWTRNIDACYTVVVNAMKSDSDNPSFSGKPYTNIVSNNVDNTNPKTIEGIKERVKANPGYEDWSNVKPTQEFNPEQKELKADTYVGYFTNTQGGIYLAYSQLAQTKDTTFTGKLSTGEEITVARIPAAIIMTDGGANFAFNEMDRWDEFYGTYAPKAYGGDGFRHDDTTKDYKDENVYDENPDNDVWNMDGKDLSHRLGHDITLPDGQIQRQVGDEWYNVYLPGQFDKHRITSLYNNGALEKDGTLVSGGLTLRTPPNWDFAGIFYSNDNDPFGTSGAVLETLLTAAYMRYVTETHYTTGWDDNKATKDSRSDLLTFTMSVDSKNVPQWGRMRLYPSLDPKEYSLDSDDAWWNDETRFDSEDVGLGAESVYNKTAVYNGLKNSWQSWKSGQRTTANFVGQQRGYIDTLPTDGYTDSRFDDIKVNNQNVIDNIAYADDFFDIESGDITNKFDQILSEITGNVFIPISGDNDAGVGNSITYQDPLGEYMEIKHQAINAHTHMQTTEGEVGTYDMSMLLFGKMHGLVRAGVYDYQWNNDYMHNNPTKDGYPVDVSEINPDEDPLQIGWYKGDAENAVYSYNKETGLPDGFENAEAAWADGWVLRLDYQTLAEYVPISGITEGMAPVDVPEQVKNTVYTCYRFAGDKKDRNALKINPVYGEEIPEELKKIWAVYEATGTYPVGMDAYSGYPGVYRLSDIRVWEEHTGDFVDQLGAITPEDKGGYDDSLYVNIPAAAVPTQFAEITLGPNGPISYKTNLDDKVQSTPFRLFYAVGLTEDLIQRDADGNQTGVDVSKISGEYIASHSDPETNNIYFISNWYSNTTYTGYTSDDEGNYRTRGDAAVTFSPDAENRYYVFQKPLPLFAHAYRVQDGGSIVPVDRAEGEKFKDDKSGNSKTEWETVNGEAQSASSWVGGEFIGTYADGDAFKTALEKAQTDYSDKTVKYIVDDKGYTYPLPGNLTDAVITLLDDQLDRVRSESSTDSSYTEDSVSFSSDDYFFLCVEYYVPMDGKGKNINGEEVEGTNAVRKVSRMIARKGSAFGSGLHSENIGNGDMLCWSDINGKCTIEIEYNSRNDTGDNTRGEPTFEKLTCADTELEQILRDYGLREDDSVTWTEGGVTQTGTSLARDVAYWTSVRNDPHMQTLIEQIKNAGNEAEQKAAFNELFDWSVSARTGGIRVGDMFNNVQAKLTQYEADNKTGPSEDGGTQYYIGNVTHTANNYYIPTLSETSTAGAGLIIDNYLGNNGRLEIANSTLMVTKTLVPPDGFTLTNDQQNEIFDYQVYVQGVTGERAAQRIIWNPLSGSWQKRVESLDILTDNSSLVMNAGGGRALFCLAADGKTPQLVIAANDGSGDYYYADANGNASGVKCEHPGTLYCMYLPGSGDEMNYHLFGSSYDGYEYDGKKTNTEYIPNAGTTAYLPESMSAYVDRIGDNENQKFAIENSATVAPTSQDYRPAGSREYWTDAAILIPYSEVQDAERPLEESFEGYALEGAADNRYWSYEESTKDNHKPLSQFTLVTVIPDPESTDSTVYSPFSSRTQYMTVDLYFGYNAKLAEHLKGTGETFADCKHLNDKYNSDDYVYKLSGTELYDQVIPSADRPDLFGGKTLDGIAANTAEFTLKNGEGLLLTGLDNRIIYRFTEKLTDSQIEQGYTLKEISHVQQRGSDTVYMPGVQEIPVYKNADGTITWAIGPDGLENSGATKDSEPFAHTNATIWESYATMTTLGNHHQPQASGVVAQNPSCVNAETEKNLGVKGCDLSQGNDTTRHYFYYGGKLVDPHYNGEVEGMSRYVLNPTVHFGVNGETQDSTNTVHATNPTSGYYDYTGVYSTYGNTGYFTEQANYTNTIDPEMLVLTKKLVDDKGNEVKATPDQEFVFTLNFNPVPTDKTKTIYLWRGDRETMTSNQTWTHTTGEVTETHKMPEKAPALDKYQDFLSGEYQLEPIELEDTILPDDTVTGSYTIKLKANEAAVFYGMLKPGTTYTVTETENSDYPVVTPGEPGTEPVPGNLSITGTIQRSQMNPVEIMPSTAKNNRADFTNLMTIKSGSLEVEKKVLGDTPDKDRAFGFTVTFTAEAGKTLDPSDFEVTKKDSEGKAVESFDLKWDPAGGGNTLKASFTLKDGEKIKFDKIPLGTTYNVQETGKDGYNLQHVADNPEDKMTDGKYLTLTEFGVEGTITDKNSEAYYLFANEKAVIPPFTGGIGVGGVVLSGVLLIGLALALIPRKKHRRCEHALNRRV